MSEAADFELRGDEAATILSLKGELTITRLDALLRRLDRALQERQLAGIDLAGLRYADSAALALLVALTARARTGNSPPPRIMGLPPHLLELLNLYHLQHVLSLA